MAKGFSKTINSTLVFGALLGITLPSLPATALAQDSHYAHSPSQGDVKTNQFSRASYGAPAAQNSASDSHALRIAMEGQQEKFINEILRLKRKLKVLESRTAAEEDSHLAEEGEQIRERIAENDFALREEIRREQSRTAKALKELENYKELYREARLGKKGKDELLVEIQRGQKVAKKQEKEIASLTAELDRAQAQLAKFQELRKSFRETRNAAEQLQLALQAKGQVETDNEFLRKKVAELESLQQRRTGSAASRQAEIGDLKSDVVRLRKALAKLAKENESLTSSLAGKKDQYEALVGSSKEALETIANLEKKVASRDERIASLEEALKEFKGAKEQLSSIESKNADLERAELAGRERIAELEKQVASLTSSEQALQADVNRVTIALESKDAELIHAKRHLCKALGDASMFKVQAENGETAATKIPELAKKISLLEQSVSAQEKKNRELAAELADKNVQLARIPEMEKALVAAKGELLMKQTEIRLFRGGTQPAASAPKVQATSGAPAAAAPKSRSVRAIDKLLNGSGPAFDAMRQMQGLPASSPSSEGSDVAILEVTGNKVNLRSGPGEEHSPVMQVKKGTRLTVEHRQGEWVRVLAPTGGRAWVRSDLADELSPPSTATTVAQAQGSSRPRKPARRSLRDGGAVVPFGEVKIAGRGKSDLDSLAMEQIKLLKIEPARK